ncbi:MAG: hypothetical protein AAF551_04030 [Bacteroidota bacterium]
MKIIQPTLESFLKKTNRVYIRTEQIHDVWTIVLGGFRSDDGWWTEFHSPLNEHDTAEGIIQHLVLMLYIIKEQKKPWTLDRELTKKNAENTFKMSRVTFRHQDEDFPFLRVDLGLN